MEIILLSISLFIAIFNGFLLLVLSLHCSKQAAAIREIGELLEVVLMKKQTPTKPENGLVDL